MSENEKSALDLVRSMTASGKMIVTAESCTGGMIAAAITDIAGSSAVLDRGFVTYSNQAKHDMLGVSNQTLETYGAVSRQTAIEMAQGALEHSSADISVSVTGVAGPGAGSSEKPVGLVHMAIAQKNAPIQHVELRFGDLGRAAVRSATVAKALDALLQLARA